MKGVEVSKDIRLGPTGQFPDGKAYPGDEGELSIAIAIDPVNKLIIVEFGKSVAFLGLTVKQAIEIGDALINKAKKIEEMENASGTEKRKTDEVPLGGATE